MQTETRTEAAPAPTPADYRSLPEERWQDFFDDITNALQGRQVEIEVVGLDLGDQIQAEWLSLNGLTYDPNDDTFYVYVEDTDMMFDHGISHPKEILVHLGATGGLLDQVIVVDAEGRRHLVRLREPLELPAPSDLAVR